jgi:hypothetical protein
VATLPPSSVSAPAHIRLPFFPTSTSVNSQGVFL